MQEELSTLRSTVKAIQDMMTQQGFFEDKMNKQRRDNKVKSAVQKVQRMNKEAECTRQASRDERQRREGREESDPLEKSQQIIREAKAAKSHLFATKGNNDHFNITVEQNMNVTRSADVDERYLVLGAHVDPNIQQKIICNEYVDFTKLLPKGQFSREDDN